MAVAKFLIDANLPYRFSLWSGENFQYVMDINERMTDSEIWSYARSNEWVVVTKDADFSHLAMLSVPPPWVVHICLGNLKMREFHQRISSQWRWIEDHILEFRMIRVFNDRVEAIG